MLVEGAHTLSRVPGDLGVAARATSLPSSSTSNVSSRPARSVSEGEGTSLPKGGEDRLILSEAARNLPQAAEQDIPHQQPGVQNNGVLNATESEETQAKAQEERLSETVEDVAEGVDGSLLLRFRHDDETGETIFQLVEPETGDVVRQVPEEEMLEFMKRFDESVSGLLFSQQA